MTRRVKFVLAALHGLLLIVFVLNAWMSDDSYITFRSVEQFIAGNGLRWNGFERVQGYTSVLWFFLLALFRLLIADIYYVAILTSLACCAVTVWIMRKIVVDDTSFCTLLLVLIASPSVIDYTTSGLENPLAYLLLALFCWLILEVDHATLLRRLPIVLLVAGLTPLVRHDLAVLVWPTTVLLLFYLRSFLRLKKLSSWLVIAATPLIAWTLFSLIYYGSPVPNTAHAKLATGIRAGELIRSGLIYVWVSCRDDPVAGLLLAGGIGAAWLRGGIHRAIAIGLLLHLAYVITIGGDFMRGRFLSFDVLLAAILVAHLQGVVRWRVALPVAGFALLVLIQSPFSTLFPTAYFSNRFATFAYIITATKLNNGVIDEKRVYIGYTGLAQRLRGEAVPLPTEICEHSNCVQAEDLQQCALDQPLAKCTQVAGMIGMVGYLSGHTARIIDAMALTDPLLARLPPEPSVMYRAGHASRRIPKGYIESVRSGQNLIEDKRVAALYNQIKLVTQSGDLFCRERLRAIWQLNTGQLKYLMVGDYL